LLSAAEALLPLLVGWWALIAIFTILPDLRISWRDSWLGALCSAVLWSVGARVFGAYLSWTTSQKYAGAVGALIALIVWVNFMAIVTLLGARLNKLLCDWKGKVLQPYSFAEIEPETILDNRGTPRASDGVRSADNGTAIEELDGLARSQEASRNRPNGLDAPQPPEGERPISAVDGDAEDGQ
jgi:membrane protein